MGYAGAALKLSMRERGREDGGILRWRRDERVREGCGNEERLFDYLEK